MKKIMSLMLGCLMVFNLCACGNSAQSQMKNTEALGSDIQALNVADAVYTGKIITMDAKNAIAEAVAVKDGKMIYPTKQ